MTIQNKIYSITYILHVNWVAPLKKDGERALLSIGFFTFGNSGINSKQTIIT